MTLADADERGTTRIAPNVVERIAEVAAGEVAETIAIPRRLLGVSVGSEHTARVKANVNAARASLRVDLAVRYPAPVSKVAEAVRRQITDRLGELAGIAVLSVDVTVRSLQSGDAAPARVR